MRKSLELKAQAEKLYTEKAKPLLAKIEKENRQPTADERTEIDALDVQIESLLADAKRFEKMENRELERTGAVDPARLSLQEDDEDKQPEKKKTVKVFETLGHQLQAIYRMAMKPSDEDRNKLLAAATGAGEVIDSDGGFALQADFVQGIEKRMFESGSIMSLLSPLRISGNQLVERFIDETSRATGSRWGAVRAYWIDEGDTITASKLKFDKLKTELQKLAALGYASNELLEDYPAMSGLFEAGFADEIIFMTEDAIFEGDGVGKPMGILNAAATVEVSKETNQAAATIVPKNLSRMWQRMHTRSKSKSVWLIHNECNVSLDELAIPVGTGVLEPRFVQYGPDGLLRIKGRPVIEVEYASALGTVGDIMLADFSQYRFINKGGISQAQSMHVRFANDEMAFRATYRCGGQPRWKTAITPFKGSNTVTPFVKLATRA